jgi:hypothetical protein
MDCPKCNMKNADGATYCAFCYERFGGRSAADTYLQAMKRVRALENNGETPTEPSSVEPTPAPRPRDRSKATRRLIFFNLSKFFRRFWRPLGLLAAGVLTLFFIQSSLNPVIRFHYFGGRLLYAFPAQKPSTYIFGSTTDAVRWSERGGQMDTPMGDLKIEDIGTVDVQGIAQDKKTTGVTVTSKNWLLNIHRHKGLESHLLSNQPQFLSPSYFHLDAHGSAAQRQQGASIRVAKSVAFLAVTFPSQRISEKTRWSDQAQWTDALDGWAVTWSTVRRWQVVGPVECGKDLCVQLHYETVLTPHIQNQPPWMHGAAWESGAGHGTGDLVFNLTQKMMVSHHMNYVATLRAGVPDVGLIPAGMRVGRRAFHSRGEIIFNLKNSSSLQRN